MNNKLYREIEQDLGPLYHQADLVGWSDEIIKSINDYLERGVTSYGTVIPDNVKLKVLNGEW